MRLKVLTAVVILVGVAGPENKALADPYADDVVSLQRVMEGWTSSGAELTVKNDDTAVDTGVDVIGRPDLSISDRQVSGNSSIAISVECCGIRRISTSCWKP